MRQSNLKIGLPLAMVVWVVKHPGEELSTTEVREIFHHSNVYSSLRHHVENRLLLARKGEQTDPNGTFEYFYSAGPALQKIIDRCED